MKTSLINTSSKQERRRNDFPETQVGFPERNDVSSPIEEMERLHVDFDTLNVSRTSADEFTREITGQTGSARK
jgi:hypothetical protein